jgi:chromosomal replication initiation ATPase DnaA
MSNADKLIKEVLPEMYSSGDINRSAYLRLKSELRHLMLESSYNTQQAIKHVRNVELESQKTTLIKTLHAVYSTVNSVCGVDIKKDVKKAEYTAPRQIYMIICRDRYKASVADIMEFIEKERSSFYKNYKSGINSLMYNEDFKSKYDEVLKELLG